MPLLKSTLGRVLLAVGLVLAVGLAVTAYQVHYRWKWAVHRYQKELVAAGEKLKIDDLLPPLAAPESNGLPYFREASVALSWRGEVLDKNPPRAMPLVAPGWALIAHQQPDLRGEKTNTWEEAEADVANYAEAFESLQQLFNHPVLDFQLNYREGATLLLPHLAQLKGVAQRLSAGAMCDLHRGRPEAAALKIRLILAVTRGMQDEPLVITHLVRIAMAQIAVPATWELLQSPAVNEQPLAVLQKDWMQTEFLAGGEQAVAFERAMQQMMIAQMRKSGEAFRRLTGSGPMMGGMGGPGANPSFAQAGQVALISTAMSGRENWWRFAWSYPDELLTLQGDQALLTTFRQLHKGTPLHTALSQQDARLAELGIQPGKEESGWYPGGNGWEIRKMFSGSVLSLQRFVNRIATMETTRHLTVAAIALKRYELRHGSYPPDLAALVPDFLPAVPRDPMDGAPLRYRKAADGPFVLYSVGEDGKDDGGNPLADTSAKPTSALYWLKGRDVVWPRQATPAQVAEYYRTNGPYRNR